MNKDKKIICGPEAVKKLNEALGQPEKNLSVEERLKKLETEVELLKDLISNSIKINKNKTLND